MKKNRIYIILLLILFSLLSCQKQHIIQNTKVITNDNYIRIEKDSSGFNIYDIDNELLLEFTKDNTDTASIETIQYILDNINENKKIIDIPKEKIIYSKISF